MQSTKEILMIKKLMGANLEFRSYEFIDTEEYDLQERHDKKL